MLQPASEPTSRKDEPRFFVHEKALCDSTTVGDGTRIWAFAHVLKGAKIGKHCNLGEGVFVEGGVVIGDNCTLKNGVAVWEKVTLENCVFIGPNAVFTNDYRPRSFIRRGSDSFLPTVVKQGATLGANVTIVCGHTIGEYAMVGAGSVVTKDVPAHALVVGNPARVIGRICYCGERLNNKDFCPACDLSLKDNSHEKAVKKHAIGD